MGKNAMTKKLGRKAPEKLSQSFEVVQVPREKRDVYWLLPWESVLRAADAGIDGLRKLTVSEKARVSAGFAWLRKHPSTTERSYSPTGDGGRTTLYQQEW